MKRMTWLAVVCLLGGLMVATVVSGLREPARAVEVAAPSASALDVVINEVAWGGTAASSTDEWIELYNTTAATVSLDGWRLVDDDNLNIALSGDIPPHGYYLIERTDDNTISDIPADWFGSFGSGGLANSGQVLTLTDNLDSVIDTANAENGGSWPAGSGSPDYCSMERIGPTAPDNDANWCANDGITRNGLDAGGAPINGTPTAQNSCYQPPTGPVADLSVTKSGPATVDAGDIITYHVTLSNTGTTTATGTLLTDTLPAAVGFVTQTSIFTCTGLGRDLVWQLGDVPTGTQYLITITGRVTDTAFSAFTNLVTATTTASETVTTNNHAAWTIGMKTTSPVYLPLILRNYTPPPYWVIIEAVLYDGLQYNDPDEAVLLLNGGDGDVDLTGWRLCDEDIGGTCAILPTTTLSVGQRVWLANWATDFCVSFGFLPDLAVHSVTGVGALGGSWPGFANGDDPGQDEVVLRDGTNAVIDTLVYETGATTTMGWSGPAVQPYGGSNFAEPGQILYRYPDEETGLPPADTDTAADWAQYTSDPWQGRCVRYPGWDLEQFFQPALGASGTVTAGIAPDNAYQLVVDTIRSAEESIEVEVYTLEHAGLVTELVQQAQQGISITVLLEGGPVGGVEDQELWACEMLHATGHGRCYFMVNSETLKIYDRYTFMHAKFIVVDRKRLLLGSQNLTHSSLPGDDKSNGTSGSRGVVLVTDAPEMVARAVEIFEADCDPDHHADVSLWGPDNVLGYGSPPPGFVPDTGEDWMTYTVQFPQPLVTTGDWFELVTAPEAALRTGDALLGLVARAGAGDAVYVEQLYEHATWGDGPNLRLESYIAAARRGATVRILLNGGNFGIEYFSLTNNVEAAAYVNSIAASEGLDLGAHLGDPTQYGIHNKMVLVNLGGEGQYVHAGSINGSETSNKINREMALQVRSDDLYDYLYAAFDYDWNHEPPLGHLLISEVMYRPSDSPLTGEWVEIYNPTAENVALSGWYLGDMIAEVSSLPDDCGDGMYRFPAGAVLPAGGLIVVAQQAADAGFTPDYEFLIDPHRDTAGVPNLVRVDPGTCDGLALTNTGDEIVLRDSSGTAVDVVVYGGGDFFGVVPHPGEINAGHSLERRPPERDSDDCSQDFFDRYPPTPGVLPE